MSIMVKKSLNKSKSSKLLSYLLIMVNFVLATLTIYLVNIGLLSRDEMIWLSPIVIFILLLLFFAQYMFRLESKYMFLRIVALSAIGSALYLSIFLIATFNSSWN
jgi:hypothetical protein